MGAYNSEVLFLHIPKAAGWTVKSYMNDVLPPEDPQTGEGGVLMPLDSDGNRVDNGESGLPIGHVRLQDIERFTGRNPDSFDLIFACVRNPYEQQLSQWKFWLDRYHQGGRHVHDRIAAKYDCLPDFLRDPRCDFHVWYEQHFGYPPRPHPPSRQRYDQFGGLFRYWITVDGEIPENVRVIRTEDLDTALPEILEPYSALDEMPEVPVTNSSSHPGNTMDYYSAVENGQKVIDADAVMRVERKAGWVFSQGFYERWSERFGGPQQERAG